MPPEAFTPMSGLTASLIRRTSSSVAPPVENPVDVFTKCAPAVLLASHARFFSSSVSRHVSKNDLYDCFFSHGVDNSAISRSTRFQSSGFDCSTLITISTSSSAVLRHRPPQRLWPQACTPQRKTDHAAGRTPLPSSCSAA